MNCKQCEQRIAESLAAGASALPADVIVHQNACPACRGFFTAQKNLFQSIDTGLRSLVNQPVPPSLLPAVRDRLDAQSLPGGFRIPNWSFAVVAALAILAVGSAYRFRPPAVPANSPLVSSVASRPEGHSQPVAEPDHLSPSVVSKSKVKHAVPSDLPSAADNEVIVLAEERQAFAKFVAEIPEEQDVAIALTRPARAGTEEPIEIARLQIDSLEVKPLEASSKD